MATTRQIKQNRAVATRPFYAAVGAGDLAVAFARSTAGDVQTRLSKVDLQPKALREQGRSIVTARVDELGQGAKDAQARLETRVAELQKDAKALPGKVESLVNGYLAALNDTVEDLNKQYLGLAVRGNELVVRIRRQQATQDVKAETKKTVSKAKTTATQTKKAGSTAKRSAKATGTTAKKSAGAAKKATADAAAKTGA
jgi:heparin binding hemagglutinin HbhA